MSKTLSDLKRLVASSEPVRIGTVTEIRTASIVVKSPVGLKQFSVASPGSFRVGGKVRFQGEVFIASLPTDVNLPTYSV